MPHQRTPPQAEVGSSHVALTRHATAREVIPSTAPARSVLEVLAEMPPATGVTLVVATTGLTLAAIVAVVAIVATVAAAITTVAVAAVATAIAVAVVALALRR